MLSKCIAAVKPLRALILNFSEISPVAFSAPQTLLRVGECASVLQRKLRLLRSFDRFAGGRSLTAIVECENLNPTERCILNYFGHCGGFKTNSFLEFKTHKMETIAKKIGASEKTARRAIHSLIEKGYLIRKSKGGPRGEGPSEYAITEKLFLDYEAKWLNRELNKPVDLGVPGGQSGSPEPEDLGVPGGQSGSPIILPLNSSPSSVIHPSSFCGEDSRVREGNTTMADSLSLSKLTKFSRDNFDAVFARSDRRRGDRSLGFDFDEANFAVADVVDQIGYDRAKEFSEYLLRYKAYTRRKQIKVSETPRLLQRFLSGDAEARACG